MEYKLVNGANFDTQAYLTLKLQTHKQRKILTRSLMSWGKILAFFISRLCY